MKKNPDSPVGWWCYKDKCPGAQERKEPERRGIPGSCPHGVPLDRRCGQCSAGAVADSDMTMNKRPTSAENLRMFDGESDDADLATSPEAREIATLKREVERKDRALEEIKRKSSMWVSRQHLLPSSIVVEDDGQRPSVRVLNEAGKVAALALSPVAETQKRTVPEIARQAAERVASWSPAKQEFARRVSDGSPGGVETLAAPSSDDYAARRETPVPIAWAYDLANYYDIDTGEYSVWRSHLSWSKPTLCDGSIRNLTPLVAAPPVPSPSGEVG